MDQPAAIEPAPARLSQRQVLLINLSALALALCWLGAIVISGSLHQGDFAVNWQAARNLIDTDNPYVTPADSAPESIPFHDPATGKRTIFYLYPPFIAYLYQPLGLLSLVHAKWIWFAINSLMLGMLIIMAIKASRSTLAARYWGVVTLATLLAPPTRLSLQLGQVSILLALLMVGCLLLERRRPALAGALLALAALIKMYPVWLAGYYLLTRQWRLLAGALVTGLALCALLLISNGTLPFLGFLHIARHENYYPYSAEFNTSIIGFWHRLLIANPFGVVIADVPALAHVLVAGCALAVVACCLSTREAAPDLQGRLTQASLWMCGMLLLTPSNGSYNLVLMLLPCLIMLRRLELSPSPHLRAALILSTALMCVPSAWTAGVPTLYSALHNGWGLLLLTPQVYGMAIYLALLWRLSRSAGSDDRHQLPQGPSYQPR